jgi:hypothetical protein
MRPNNLNACFRFMRVRTNRKRRIVDGMFTRENVFSRWYHVCVRTRYPANNIFNVLLKLVECHVSCVVRDKVTTICVIIHIRQWLRYNGPGRCRVRILLNARESRKASAPPILLPGRLSTGKSTEMTGSPPKRSPSVQIVPPSTHCWFRI